MIDLPAEIIAEVEALPAHCGGCYYVDRAAVYPILERAYRRILALEAQIAATVEEGRDQKEEEI